MANYDKIAPYYDFLSRLVFFRSQVNAQINQLKYIKSSSSILIVGGGTGWILEEIGKIHPQGLTITYLEISNRMISLSKRRQIRNNEVKFICSAVQDYQFSKQFDAILTPFLFDNFSIEEVDEVFAKLVLQLKNGGRWFMVDFNLPGGKGKWWRSFLLKAIYAFFKFLGIVKVSDLIDVTPYFKIETFRVIETRNYYRKFVKATVYEKRLST